MSFQIWTFRDIVRRILEAKRYVPVKLFQQCSFVWINGLLCTLHIFLSKNKTFETFLLESISARREQTRMCLLFETFCSMQRASMSYSTDKIVIWLENNKVLYPEGKSLPSALKCPSDLTSFKR